MLNGALAILKDEHRSLAAVLRGLRFLMGEIAAGRRAADFGLLHAMLHYIETFPEKLHHPKESAYLFTRLARRTHEADEVLRQLEQQHADSAAQAAELRRALTRLERGERGALAALHTAVERYTQDAWVHMDIEERVILPLALQHLLPEDWVEIGAAFGENGDPRFSADPEQDYGALFASIVRLVAPPLDADPREPPGRG